MWDLSPWTCDPRTARRNLNHWTIREVPDAPFTEIQLCKHVWVCVRMSKQEDRSLPPQSLFKFCCGTNLTGERVCAFIFYSHKFMNHVLVTEERKKDKKTQQEKSINEKKGRKQEQLAGGWMNRWIIGGRRDGWMSEE